MYHFYGRYLRSFDWLLLAWQTEALKSGMILYNLDLISFRRHRAACQTQTWKDKDILTDLPGKDGEATFRGSLVFYLSVSFITWYMTYNVMFISGFPGGSGGTASVYNAGDLGLIPGSGRSPGEGDGNPLQYYCLENPMDTGAW